MTKESRRKKLLWMRPLMILAVLAGLFMLYQKVYYESRDFYAENFSAPAVSSSFSSYNDMSGQASEKFSSGDYSSALPLLDRLTADEAIGTEARLYKGICLMEKEEYWAAIDEFEAVKKQSPQRLQEVEWYKILSLIGLERKDEALEMLAYYCEQDDFDFKRSEALSLLEEY